MSDSQILRHLVQKHGKYLSRTLPKNRHLSTYEIEELEPVHDAAHAEIDRVYS